MALDILFRFFGDRCVEKTPCKRKPHKSGFQGNRGGIGGERVQSDGKNRRANGFPVQDGVALSTPSNQVP